MNIEITRPTILTIAFTVAITLLAAVIVYLSLSVRSQSSQNVSLRNRIAELEVTVQDQTSLLANKDTEITQLSESKTSLSKSVEQLQAEKPQKEAVEEALSALRKIEAAMKIGSDMFNFNRLMAEAQAKVTESSNILPKGKLKANLESAISNYEYAIRSMRAKISERDEELQYLYQNQVHFYATEASKNIKAATNLVGSTFNRVESP